MQTIVSVDQCVGVNSVGNGLAVSGAIFHGKESDPVANGHGKDPLERSYFSNTRHDINHEGAVGAVGGRRARVVHLGGTSDNCEIQRPLCGERLSGGYENDSKIHRVGSRVHSPP